MSAGGFSLRPAQAADYPQICAFFASPEALFLVYPGGQYPLTPEQLQEVAARRSDLTVLCQGEVVVGFANLYQLLPGESAFIGNVVVSPLLRGQGGGRLLVQHMLQRCFHGHGLKRVHISVFGHNHPAMLLYASLGFVPYGVEARQAPDGHRVALIHLSLERSA